MSEETKLQLKIMVPYVEEPLSDDEKTQILKELEQTNIKKILSGSLGQLEAKRAKEFITEMVDQSRAI